MRKFLFVLLFALTPVCAQEVITNQSVVSMCKAGLSEQIVVEKIRATASRFDVSEQALIGLKQAGVPEAVIMEMIQATRRTPPSQKRTGVLGAWEPQNQEAPAAPPRPMDQSAPTTVEPRRNAGQQSPQRDQQPVPQPSPSPSGYSGGREFPRVEAFGGFSYRRFDGLNTLGWNGSVVGNINSWFGVVGDVSGHYKGFGGLADIDFHTVMAGPQFSVRRGRVSGFARALVGGTNGGFHSFGDSESAWVFSYGFGGGVDVGITRSLAIRVFQSDGIFERNAGDQRSSGRISFGVVGRF